MRSVVIVTSYKCYENCEQIWGYRETDAMRAFTAPLLSAQGWNFGPPEQMNLSVEDVVSGLAATLGPKFQWRQDPSDDLHEATFLKLDCSAARHHLGWQPQVDAAQMTEWTAAWYRGETVAQRNAIVARQVSDYSKRLTPAD